jgi:hypothetical protein
MFLLWPLGISEDLITDGHHAVTDITDSLLSLSRNLYHGCMHANCD